MAVFSGETCIGNELVDMFSKAESEILIVAPFIKLPVLERIICSISPEIPVHCITRWRPDEIVNGISDMGIWPLLKKRKRFRLQLHYNLHAKYYRADNNCMIGSANLTNSALTWCSNWNLELMVKMPASDTKLFETYVVDAAVDVDDYIYKEIYEKVLALEQNLPRNPLILAHENNIIISTQFFWIPKLRYPQDLYSIYIGETDNLLSSTVDFGISDLIELEIPTGLSKENFYKCLQIILLQQPIVKIIDNFLTEPRHFGAMTKFLKGKFMEVGISADPVKTWQALMRWLTFFLPEKYKVKVPHYSEVIYKW